MSDVGSGVTLLWPPEEGDGGQVLVAAEVIARSLIAYSLFIILIEFFSFFFNLSSFRQILYTYFFLVDFIAYGSKFGLHS